MASVTESASENSSMAPPMIPATRIIRAHSPAPASPHGGAAIHRHPPPQHNGEVRSRSLTAVYESPGSFHSEGMPPPYPSNQYHLGGGTQVPPLPLHGLSMTSEPDEAQENQHQDDTYPSSFPLDQRPSWAGYQRRPADSMAASSTLSMSQYAYEYAFITPRMRVPPRQARVMAGGDAGPVSRFRQFTAGVTMGVQRRRRHWITLGVEILLPILFVVAVVWLQVHFTKRPAKEDTEPIQYTNVYALPNWYQAWLCYNSSSTGSTIPTIRQCHPSYETIECSFSPALPFPPGTLCVVVKNSEGDLMSWEWMVAGFLGYTMGSPIPVRNLDYIIAGQWVGEGNRYKEELMAKQKAASEQTPEEQEEAAKSDLVSGLMSLVSALGSSGASPQYTRLDSLLSSGMLYFAPAALVPEELITYLKQTSAFFGYVYGGTFDTMEAVEAHILRKNEDLPLYKRRHWGIVEIFDIKDSFNVQLHFNGTALPAFEAAQNIDFDGFYYYNSADMYLAAGFIHLQKVLYDYYIHSQKESGRIRSGYDPITANLPFTTSVITPSEAREYQLLAYARPLVAFVLVLAFVYPFMQMVKNVVTDRELRIREATSIMGLRRAPLYCCYFFLNALQGTITVTLFAIAIRYGLMRNSSFSLIWLIFLVYYMTLIPLAALVGACFSSARFATQMAPIVYFLIVIPPFIMSSSPLWLKYTLSALFSPAAVSEMLQTVLLFVSGSGFHNNAMSSPFVTGVLPSRLFLLLTGDIALYTLLMLYVDYVTPGNYGPAHHPLFFILSPIRRLRSRCRGEHRSRSASEAEDREEAGERGGVFEPRGQTRSRRVVELKGLVKEYRRGGKRFRAVDDLRWVMHDCEISVLLGENGAGKSTTVGMLTGMEKMDGGDCWVEGYSVRHALRDVRQLLGYCPQHNILWPDLTCCEHLKYYGKLKGLTGDLLEIRMENILELVDLVDKRDALASHLSGGQKRKLSVAIAFMGDNALVILDEPTAGMDAAARRHMWQLLRLMSAHTTILLTTHFLDEADLLGDTIGIMQGGRLRCAGSSLYLKSKLGRGYTLSVELETGDTDDTVGSELRVALPDLVPLSENAREKLYSVPKASCRGMPAALRVLETRGAALGVRGFSVSATTLEEVFLAVVERAAKGQDIESGGYEASEPQLGQQAKIQGSADGDWWQLTPSPSDTKSRTKLLLRRFQAVLRERCLLAKRDRRFQVLQILCPLVCALLAVSLVLVHFSPPSLSSGVVTYDLSTFEISSQATIAECNALLGSAVEWMQALDKEAQASLDTSSMSWTASMPSPLLVDVASTVVSTVGLVKQMVSRWYSTSRPQYMGFMCHDPEFTDMVRSHQLGSERLPSTITGLGVVYNTSSTPSLPIALHTLYKQIVRHGFEGQHLPTFRLTSKPMPWVGEKKNETGMLVLILLCLILIIPFAFLPAAPAGWVVKERECKARHMERLAGLGNGVYWISNFVFDFLVYCVALLLVVCVLIAFRHTEFVGSDTVGPFLVTQLLYGVTSTLMAYVMSFFFTDHTTAQMVVAFLSFGTGFILLIVIAVLDMLAGGEQWVINLRFVCRIFPTFCVGDMLLSLTYLSIGMKAGSTPWSMTVAGWPSVFLAGEIPLCLLSLFILEAPQARRIPARVMAVLRRCCQTQKENKQQEKGSLCERQELEEGERQGITSRSTRTNTSDSTAISNIEEVKSDRPHLMNASHDPFVSVHVGVEGAQSWREGWGGASCNAQVHVSWNSASPGVSLAASRFRQSQAHPAGSPSVSISFQVESPTETEAVVSTPLLPRTLGYSTLRLTSMRQSIVNSFAVRASMFMSNNRNGHDAPQSRAMQRRAPYVLPGGKFYDPCLHPGLHEPCMEEEDGGSITSSCTAGSAGCPFAVTRLEDEDSDVEDERIAVHQDAALKRRYPVQLVDVQKVYPNGLMAVRSLSFSVMPGEVFALLGTNGSGKTTTMSMLCQEQSPTGGRLFVDGHNTVSDSEAARRRVGYCPQFDATLDLLTVEEHLQLFADIHGVDYTRRKEVVERLMEVCGITAFRNVLSKDLSGGNRRKLSVAMSLVGGPSVVCLDEPSAGMDPMARRRLWESILAIARRCSVLLTTHHMEEVEALASCVGIMSRGALRCFGDMQHLKRKYGSGYEVNLRVNRAGQQNTWGTIEDPVEEFIAQVFPGCVINECFRGERYVLSLPADNTVLSFVFQILQENQERLGITDFIVSQTSMEQVFLHFCDLSDAFRLDD